MNEQMNCWANLCANHPLRVGPFLVWANFGSKPNVGLLIPHLPPQTTGGHLLYMETDGQQGREMKLHPLHIFCTILQNLKSLHFYKIKHLWKVVVFLQFLHILPYRFRGGGQLYRQIALLPDKWKLQTTRFWPILHKKSLQNEISVCANWAKQPCHFASVHHTFFWCAFFVHFLTFLAFFPKIVQDTVFF